MTKARAATIDVSKLSYETSEDFAQLFDTFNETSGKEEGSVVEGTVIAVENGLAIIDVGLKTEGRVALREFADRNGAIDVQVGDKFEVYLDRIESNSGMASVSYEKALRQRAWKLLETNYNEGDTIEGSIFGRVKGGFTVDIEGVIAFLPGSQVDIRPVRDIAPLMNIRQPFQVLKMDAKQGNIVVSRRAIMEEARAGERNEMLSNIKEGITLDGIVKNITDYGAFIDLGSVDGLLHVTDISWTRISHPSEVLKVGQEVTVKVIKFNEENKRISLGMKQLEGNPWEDIGTRFPVGAKITGNVTNVTDYGAFVQLEEGIEGLVHVSEISWSKNNQHPGKTISIGQEVEVMILDVDAAKHRISLGIKQCIDNPWEKFSEKYKVDDVIEGEVKNIVEFGLFVGLADGLDGLVHVSDVAWGEKPEEKMAEFKAGDKVTVKILAIEPQKERISLGVKQLSEDPNANRLETFKKNAVVTCIVTQVSEDGISVTVGDDVKSFIKRNDLASERIEQRPERFNVGDKVDAKITQADKKTGAITLSIRALEVDEQKRAIKEYGSTDSGASLGDILGAALNSAEKNKK